MFVESLEELKAITEKDEYIDRAEAVIAALKRGDFQIPDNRRAIVDIGTEVIISQRNAPAFLFHYIPSSGRALMQLDLSEYQSKRDDLIEYVRLHSSRPYANEEEADAHAGGLSRLDQWERTGWWQ